MSQDGGQCGIDVSILETLWFAAAPGQLSFALYSQSVPVSRSRGASRRGWRVPLETPLSPGLRGFCAHWLKRLSRADRKLILFVQFPSINHHGQGGCGHFGNGSPKVSRFFRALRSTPGCFANSLRFGFRQYVCWNNFVFRGKKCVALHGWRCAGPRRYCLVTRGVGLFYLTFLYFILSCVLWELWVDVLL